MILMYKYLCYNNVNSVILTQFSCDLLYVFILVQSFTLFVGKIALMANVLICYNWMPTLNKVSCILYLVIKSNKQTNTPRYSFYLLSPSTLLKLSNQIRPYRSRCCTGVLPRDIQSYHNWAGNNTPREGCFQFYVILSHVIHWFIDFN